MIRGKLSSRVQRKLGKATHSHKSFSQIIPQLRNRISERIRGCAYDLKDLLSPEFDYIYHIGQHRTGNFGDTCLFEFTRTMLTPALSNKWRLHQSGHLLGKSEASKINSRAAAFVVGGGGMIFSGAYARSRSGWQWNYTVDGVSELKKPIYIWGVGYNRFPGEPEFSPQFREHINAAIRAASFVGLRNRGSIEGLSNYLDEDNRGKLTWQPCPTTVLSEFTSWKISQEAIDSKRVALNFALDRPRLRFGPKPMEKLKPIFNLIRYLQQKGWAVTVVIHDAADRLAVPLLRSEGVTCRIKNLAHADPEEGLNFYRDFPLVIGMRGHGQMIPFGLGAAIINIASHNKIRFFLEDIGHAEWGLNIDDLSLEDKLVSAVDNVIQDMPKAIKTVAAAKAELWNCSKKNIDFVKSHFATSAVSKIR